ncbi:MAG: DVUA0089 family protein [Phycisphaerales bacterium]
MCNMLGSAVRWVSRMVGVVSVGAACGVVGLVSAGARAQCYQHWIGESGAAADVDGEIMAMQQLPGGDVAVGGWFRAAAGVVVNGVARYNPGTRAWAALGDGVRLQGGTGQVAALLVLPGGVLVVGGTFDHAGGVPANNVAMYDTVTGVWSAMGAGTAGSVYALARTPNGGLLVGGVFTSAGGAPYTQGLASYSAGVWGATGLVGLGSINPQPFITAICAASNGDTYVFDANSPAGTPAFRFLSHCSTFPFCFSMWQPFYGSFTPGPTSTMASILELPSGDIILAGPLMPTGSHVTLWSPAGNSFSPYGIGPNGQVWSMVATPAGDYLAVGGFTAVGPGGATAANNIARCNPATLAWSAVGPAGGAPASFPYSVLGLANGDVLAGADSIGGWATSGHLGRYFSAAGAWEPGTGTDGVVNATVRLPGGDVVVGGAFTRAGTVEASNIARYSPATGAWSAMGSGVSGGAVLSLAVTGAGDVIAGGSFTSAGVVPASHVARYSTALGTWSSMGGGAVPSVVYALAVLPNGDVMAGGSGSTAAARLRKWTSASGTWATVGGVGLNGAPGLNDAVFALAVFPNGDVYVGGSFPSASTATSTNFARYTPSSGAWTTLGFGASDPVYALAVSGDGQHVILGGSFGTVGTASAPGIGRYTPGSFTYSGLGAGVNGRVESLAALDAGTVLVGGAFTTAGGQPAPCLARVDPSSGAWAGSAGGVGGVGGTSPVEVRAIAPGVQGGFFVGGRFNNAVLGHGTLPVNNFAVWACDWPAQWDEHGDGGGDAGDQPGAAQSPAGVEPFIEISGVLDGPVDADIYRIDICDAVAFYATTFGGTSENLDTRLYLFDTSGHGVLMDDDIPAGYAGAGTTLSRVGLFTLTPGEYLLAVSHFNVDPLDAQLRPLWNDVPYAVQRAPDGPGGASALASWAGAGVMGPYRVRMEGACFAAASGCDAIDFNGDGLFPDTADIDDFLSVFSGGACSTGTCGDIDFNNDGLFPDTTDIDSLLSVFSGGPCLV